MASEEKEKNEDKKAGGESPPQQPVDAGVLALKEKVVEAIKLVYDPEIPVDVYELGLIYQIDVLPVNNVNILMTLTSPSCPSAEEIPDEIAARVREVEGVNEVNVELTFDPPFSSDMMTEQARLELGFM